MSLKAAQLKLIRLGYGSGLGSSGADGIDGKMTRETVTSFQRDYNRIFKKSITVDGKVGPQVRSALDHYIGQAGIKGTKNFKISEFSSKNNGAMLKNGMDSNLITKLEQLRYNLGNKAMVINSGYRTVAHNRAVGGASGSQHIYGKAADIVVRGVKPSVVYAAADKLFNGVGKYNTFTHVDTRASRARF